MSILFALSGGASGQSGVLGRDPSDRLGEERPTLPPFERPTPSPALVLPAPTPIATPRAPAAEGRVLVREIRVTGSTVFPPAQLDEVTGPYTNRELSFEELEAVRHALSELYAAHGYVNSGATIPDQEVRDGVVTMQIIEGELTRIEVDGAYWFRSTWIRDRLAASIGAPLNVNDLERALEVLQRDRRIARVDAELRPGLERGQAVLAVRVEEAVPYRLRLEFNNHESPSIGSEQGVISAAHDNVLGFGDALRAAFGITPGLDSYEVEYTVPLNRRETTLGLLARYSESSIVEAPFDDLDIDSNVETYGATLRQPFLRTLHSEVSFGLSFEHRRSATFLLGRPFDFVAGTDDGKSRVTVIRFTQDWIDRRTRQVIAARSRLSLGVDALGATNNRSSLPDGQFFAWLLQAQWARRLSRWNVESIARVDLQLTPDPLLSLEQIAVGGSATVRGYRENRLVRDNGAVGSLEIRVPVWRDARGIPIVQVAPFFDVGSAWATRGPTPDPKYIASLGLGLRWEIARDAHAELYWGGRLHGASSAGGENDPQDRGLHFQVYWDLSPPLDFAKRIEPWLPWD